MPLIIPKTLPAYDALYEENVFVMHRERAASQHIRPLEILILNLMPTKIATETQIARLLANITKCGFGIYIVHYFLVGPFFLLIGPSSLPIPLQVPLMSVCIFLVAWGFTALMYRLLGKKAVYIMG